MWEIVCSQNIVRTEGQSQSELQNQADRSRQTFEGMVKTWIDCTDVGVRSADSYNRALHYFYDWVVEHGTGDPCRQDIVNYRNELAGRLAPATVNAYVRAVKAFYRWLEKEGLHRDIASNVKLKKLDRGHRKGFLSSQQCRQVLDTQQDLPGERSLKKARNRALLALMMSCGLRTIEVVNADVGDISRQGEAVILHVLGKGHAEKGDFVKLPEQVLHLIIDYLTLRGRQEKEKPLFASLDHRSKDGRMDTRSIRRICKEAFAMAGLDTPNLSAHSLRHSAATIALQQGSSVEQVQQVLRHSNINTTMIYVHDVERMNNAAEEKVADSIFEEAC